MTAQDGPSAEHTRPAGVTDLEVEATGKLSEALETLERARGHLLSFHQLMGETDLSLDDVMATLRDAGHPDLADDLAEDLVGRNVLAGRWTFQVIEEFDDGYRARVLHHERRVRERLTGGRRHVFEAEMKEERRTLGRPGHEACPRPSAGSGRAANQRTDPARRVQKQRRVRCPAGPRR